MEYPIFIDFEASSLDKGSYPIQVAFSMPDGETIESYFMNPYAIYEWTDWCVMAQSIHGRSRGYLSEHGLHPLEVARRMNQKLNNQRIYANAPAFDELWCNELFRAVDKKPLFKIYDSNGLFEHLLRADPKHKQGEIDMPLSDLIQEAWNSPRLKGLSRHDAATDVLQLVEMYRIATDRLTK